ncbi:MAG: DUF2027 domain-containing protein [Muribaculaceae bacterium]|nr:DUF2027 domain-containing protein [Muribaculaceae bacterium]
MAIKIGDTVRFLNSVGGGKVTKIEGQLAYVDDDGFETPVLVKECVVVASGDSFYAREQPAKGGTPPPPTKVAPEKPKEALPEAVETPEGEKITLVLGFEPADIKHLSTTSFDAFIVNDSNYSMYMSVSTRSRENEKWTLRFAGLIEPAIQEFLFELTTADLPEVDRISVQAIPFKTKSGYTRKAPVDFEQRLDATKFARLHCFGDNPYFDSKVLAMDIVTADVRAAEPKVDTAELEKAMQEKRRDDRRRPRPVERKTRQDESKSLLEVDLHASALLDTTAGLSPSDILNYQIDTFRRIMDANLRNVGRPIVFIHGKGEGVLRQALMKELNHRYKGHDVSDASFREYGFGATKVVIRNIPKP